MSIEYYIDLPASTAAITASLTLVNSNLSTLNTKFPSVGQALMASSVPVTVASNQSAIQVTGAFFQTTQPISGSVSVSNFPTSQAVTGAFFPATQPVSGPLTDTQLRASAVPVSGAFFPATQPVSGTISISNFPATQAVTGTFFQATQPVSAASLPLPTGAATEAGALASISSKLAAASTSVITQTTVTTASIVIAAANAARKGLLIWNNTGTVFVSLSPTATTTTAPIQLTATSGFVYPGSHAYTGPVSAIRSSGSGLVAVTELF